jgi:hypothetical protein
MCGCLFATNGSMEELDRPVYLVDRKPSKRDMAGGPKEEKDEERGVGLI